MSAISEKSSKSAKPTSPSDGDKRAKSTKRTKPKDKKTTKYNTNVLIKKYIPYMYVYVVLFIGVLHSFLGFLIKKEIVLHTIYIYLDAVMYPFAVLMESKYSYTS